MVSLAINYTMNQYIIYCFLGYSMIFLLLIIEKKDGSKQSHASIAGTCICCQIKTSLLKSEHVGIVCIFQNIRMKPEHEVSFFFC